MISFPTYISVTKLFYYSKSLFLSTIIKAIIKIMKTQKQQNLFLRFYDCLNIFSASSSFDCYSDDSLSIDETSSCAVDFLMLVYDSLGSCSDEKLIPSSALEPSRFIFCISFVGAFSLFIISTSFLY